MRHACPRCGRPVAAEDDRPLPPEFPFCSERCRLVDLGKWFDGEHRISRPVVPDALDLPDEPATD